MKYIFILITWLGQTAPYTQDVPVRNLDECREMEARLETAWENAPDEFGYVIVCRENPHYRSK